MLYFSNKLNPFFIQIYFYGKENIFLTKQLFSNSKDNNITINCLIKNNQFIEPHSTLATINILTDKLRYLKQIKRNKVKIEQLLYTVANSYIENSISKPNSVEIIKKGLGNLTSYRKEP